MNYRNTDWFRASQKIKIGQRLRMVHEGCSIGDTLLVTKKREGVSAFCFLCKESMFVPGDALSLSDTVGGMRRVMTQDAAIEKIRALPLPKTFDVSEWPLEARVWLYKAGLSNDDIEQLQIYYHEPSDRVVIPVRDNGSLVYWQARAAVPGKGRPKYLNPAHGKRETLVATWAGENDGVVLCEDFLSAYRVWKSSGYSSFSLLGTDLSDPILVRLLAVRGPAIIWLDGDKAGRAASKKIQQKLTLYGKEFIDIVTPKDPKLYSKQEILDVITNSVCGAHTER